MWRWVEMIKFLVVLPFVFSLLGFSLDVIAGGMEEFDESRYHRKSEIKPKGKIIKKSSNDKNLGHHEENYKNESEKILRERIIQEVIERLKPKSLTPYELNKIRKRGLSLGTGGDTNNNGQHKRKIENNGNLIQSPWDGPSRDPCISPVGNWPSKNCLDK